MRSTLLIIAGILLLVVGVVYWKYYLAGEKVLSPEELAQQALSAATAEEKEAAAVKLSQAGQPGIEEMRQVYQQSDVAEVRAACVKGLGVLRDYDSMDVFFKSLEDESALVRGRAGVAMIRMLGRDYRFRANGSPAERAQSIASMKKAWEEMEPDLELIKENMQNEGKQNQQGE